MRRSGFTAAERMVNPAFMSEGRRGMDEAVTIGAARVLARGWGTLTSTRLTMRRRDGAVAELVREVYDHGHAAAVLPYCPQTGKVVLVRQFRFPVHLSGDPAYLLEVPAGLLDADAPEACARREAEEETGLRLSALDFACAVYMSPGSLTEKVHCFLARYGPGDRVGPGGGLVGEGEDIEVVEMAFEAALAGVARGEIVDAKTVLLLQYAALHGLFGPRTGA
jgi:nudix-type nucleoside diphosphatase (YffH/AdpP family)